MKVDNEDKLISYLLNAHTYVDSKTLANNLNVSTKTIYRLVKRINEMYSIPLIIAEKGKGYRIDDRELLDKQEVQMQHQNDLLTPIERRNTITKDLLLISPKSLSVFKIIERFYVSESVLNSDERKIEEMLKNFNLKLVRRNRHLSIRGDETNIRRALLELMEESKLTSLLSYNDMTQLEDRDAFFVQEQINIIENYQGIIIPYPYNVNIFSHLYILIMRFRKRGVISVDKNHYTEEMHHLINEYQSFYRTSDMIISNIERYLHSKLPKNEKIYLFEYLISSRFESQNVDSEQQEIKYSDEVISITKNYINRASNVLGYSFKNKDLEQQLMKHIKPMLNRIEHGLFVKNTLIEQIKKEYPDIFLAIKKISSEITNERNSNSINEDEVGYLTLYFAKEIERNPKKNQTLITCTTGIGTSELLKTKISRNVSDIEIKDVKSTFDLSNEDLTDIELIISTVNIPDIKGIPVVVISAMFNKNDQIKLRKMIELLGDYNEK
nr:PRD domain-containing protein [Mammaliicoccus lentus]